MIEVLHPGLLATIQDLGRHGYTHLGVSPSGAADPLLLRLGNLLIGNPETAAAIEVTAGGAVFRFGRETDFVFAGDFKVMVEELPVNPFITQRLPAGATVRILTSDRTLRGYLCVAGGIDVPLVMGSRSTHRPSGLGGFGGRELRKGDQLPLGQSVGPHDSRDLPAALLALTHHRTRLRVTPGPHLASFRQTALAELASFRCRVEPDSNRIGVRLSGSPIRPLVDGILSEGVPLGALQVTPSGEMILLGVDSQTTGGYPILASLIRADLHSLGQLRPGDTVGFEVVDHATARNLLMQQEKTLYECREWLAA